MKHNFGKCDVCGKSGIFLKTNNPIVTSVCENCTINNLQHDNLEHADFFCRTMNLPLKPNLWMRMSAMDGSKTFRLYVEEMADQNKESLYHATSTQDLWKMANAEWELVKTHEELLAMMAPLRENYELRNKIKWGQKYSFDELIALESLFNRTMESNHISNPMQIDAVKKAVKMSVSLDQAIMRGDAKEINDLSRAYQSFVKTAKIDELITEASDDVISTVADLVDYIEKQGFKFDYYDGVNRDIVDQSLEDIKQYIRRLVLDTSGAQLESVFDSIDNALRVEKETLASAESYDQVSLEDLYKEAVDKREEILQEEFAEEEQEEVVFNEDDDGYF